MEKLNIIVRRKPINLSLKVLVKIKITYKLFDTKKRKKKNNTKERKRRIPDRKSKGSENGKDRRKTE